MQKFNRKFLSILLTLAMVISMIPAFGITVSAKSMGTIMVNSDWEGKEAGERIEVDETEYTFGTNAFSSVQAAVNACTGDSSIPATSTTTITMRSGSTENVTISEGKNITLDLNGHVLKGTGSGSVITNSGTLTIQDSDTTTVNYYKYNSNAAWEYLPDHTAIDSDIALADISSAALNSGETIIAVPGGCITGGSSSDNGGAITMQRNDADIKTVLNGGTIVGCSSKCGGGIFQNEGTIDMNSGAAIIGCYASESGGAIDSYANAPSTAAVNMTGGTIAFCTAANTGGGIYNREQSTLNMSETAKIMNCVSVDDIGGGVVTNGTFNMTGGTIEKCTAVKGGGVFVNSQDTAKFIMTGGSVTNNTATSRSGGVEVKGNLTLGGSANITGNTLNAAANNVYLNGDGKVITVSTTDVPAWTTPIGVTTSTSPTDGNPVAITNESSANYSSAFTSDDANYSIVRSGSVTAIVIKTAVPVAQVGTEKFASVQDAVTFASAGDTVETLATDKVTDASPKHETTEGSTNYNNAIVIDKSITVNNADIQETFAEKNTWNRIRGIYVTGENTDAKFVTEANKTAEISFDRAKARSKSQTGWAYGIALGSGSDSDNASLTFRGAGNLFLTGKSSGGGDQNSPYGYSHNGIRINGTNNTLTFANEGKTTIMQENPYGVNALVNCGTTEFTKGTVLINTFLNGGVGLSANTGLWNCGSGSKITVKNTVDEMTIFTEGAGYSDSPTLGDSAVAIFGNSYDSGAIDIQAKKLNVLAVSGEDTNKDWTIGDATVTGHTAYDSEKANSKKSLTCGILNQGMDSITVGKDTVTNIHTRDSHKNSVAVGAVAFVDQSYMETNGSISILGTTNITAEGDTGTYALYAVDGNSIIIGSEDKTVKITGDIYAAGSGISTGVTGTAKESTISLQGSTNTITGNVAVNDGAVVNLTDTTVQGDVTLTSNATLNLKNTTISAATVSNAGVIVVDMTDATDAKVELIKCSGANTYGTAGTNYKFAEGKDNGYVLKVINNALCAVRPVCSITKGSPAKTTNYTTIADAIEAADSDDTIVMIADSTENMTVAANKTVTLDLNGHVLEGTGSGSVVTVYGKFTLDDTSTEKTGKITGGKANCGGGVYVASGGIFTMNDGTISGNTAEGDKGHGGGVYICNGSTTTINGGTISDNRAIQGGGLYTAGYQATVSLLGGTITGNTDTDSTYHFGGVMLNCHDGKTYTIGGNIKIYNNTSANEVASNLVLWDVKKDMASLVIDSNKALNDADIHFCMDYQIFTGAAVANAKKTDLQYFHSDSNSYYLKHVTEQESGHLELAVANIKIADGITGGIITISDQGASTGEVTVTATPNSGYRLDKITVTDKDDSDITATALSGTTITVPEAEQLPITVFAAFKVISSGGGGGGGSSSTTVPVSGDKDTIKVTATVSGSNATIKNITAEEITKAGTGGNVTMDLSGLSKSVTGVTIPKSTFENIAASEATGLEIKLPNGTTVVFDKETLSAVAAQAKGANIQLVIDRDTKAESSMTSAQKETVKEMNNAVVLDAYFVSDGVRISDFKGGEAELTAEYPTATAVKVWFVAEDGAKTEVPCTWDGKTAKFTVGHFSHYVIEEAEPTETEEQTVCPKDSTCVYAKFTDTKTTEWYHDGIHFCVEKGYMNGVTDTTFVPNGNLSRGMLVTILHRMEGSPAVDYAMTFKDVSDDSWYTEAIRWAQSTGIVTGYDAATFGPKENVTREQLAAILWRYAKAKDYDVSVGEDTNILSYEDAVGGVSEWAYRPLQWAVGAGIMNGIDNRLEAKGNATRAQTACMIQRFCSLKK